MSGDKTYITNYESLIFYLLGGGWGYAIMRIRDNNGSLKLRLSKCKIRGEFPNSAKRRWEKIDLTHINNMSQVNHINFKKFSELDSIYTKLQEEFEEIDKIGKKNE